MHRFALAVFMLAACHPSPPAPARALEMPGAATVAHITGTWAGMAEGTPFGDIPFALAFARDADGSVHARADDGKGMYLDFRFVQRAGTWVLVEEGAIPSVGVQTHTLTPDGAAHWRDKDVDVALDVTGDALVMATTVHGKPHATFKLKRRVD